MKRGLLAVLADQDTMLIERAADATPKAALRHRLDIARYKRHLKIEESRRQTQSRLGGVAKAS